MFDEIDEIKELLDIAKKSEKLDSAMAEVPEDLNPQEYVGQVGDRINMKVLPSQTPMYKTPEEAKEASEKPELQIVDQFQKGVIQNYLKLE